MPRPRPSKPRYLDSSAARRRLLAVALVGRDFAAMATSSRRHWRSRWKRRSRLWPGARILNLKSGQSEASMTDQPDRIPIETPHCDLEKEQTVYPGGA